LVDLPSFVLAYHYERSGVAQVSVVSAMPLSDEWHQQLVLACQKRFGLSEVRLAVTVDASLEAGAIISYNNQRIDGSLQHRYEVLRKQLLAQ
jgi:F0F1-type ATP synthase delta subunit